MNQLFVGIDVSSKNNVACLMKPDGSKHSSFSVQNNLCGAKILSEKIVSALNTMQLHDVAIGLKPPPSMGTVWSTPSERMADLVVLNTKFMC